MAATSEDSPIARNFVGSSRELATVLELIRRYAPLAAPVLIVGETGTGKEIAAHIVHCLSPRQAGAFVPVNCGALPENLVESELFGHARGAFTDASRARSGLIRQAEGGTLFLDEIEALNSRGQIALLRFLQDSSFRPLGEEQTQRADVRIIAASNVRLRKLVAEKVFREDLFYRLDVLSIELPPLRNRLSDLPLLVAHILNKIARAECVDRKTMSLQGMSLLSQHSWPGNVRELEHVLLRAHLLSAGACIQEEDVRKASQSLAQLPREESSLSKVSLRTLKERAVVEVERRFVAQALSQTCGNISAAARLCGIERAAFSRMAKRIALE